SSAAACSFIPLSSTSEQISRATASRMKYSPVPLAETAHDLFDAYLPAPMVGQSPTRPQRFPVVPPVDVPAATLPFMSSAATPTVPFLPSSCARFCAVSVACAPAGCGGIG